MASVVQSAQNFVANNATANPTVTVTLGSATTAGNCLIVAVTSGNATTNCGVSGITLGGSAGNFGSLDVIGSGTTVSIQSYWADPNCAGGQTSVAVSTSGGTGNSYVFVSVLEVSGLPKTLAALLDQSAGTGSATGSTSWSSGATPTTTLSTELWVGMAINWASTTMTGPTSPWTNLTVQTGSSAATVTGWQITSSMGAATYAGTAGTSGTWSASVITLNIPVTGTVATVTATAPAGGLSYGSSKTGLTATATVTAAIGTVGQGTSVAGVKATATAGASSGTLSYGTTKTGVVATVAAAAPIGTVVKGSTVSGVTAAAASAAPAGAAQAYTNVQNAAIYATFPYGEALYGQQAIMSPVTPSPNNLPLFTPAQIVGNLAQWVIEPFIAQSMNYGAVGVSWNKPLGSASRWRLLSNRYGYPADQNDGNIVIDSASWPGNFYLDTSVIAGSFIYYGFYAQTDPVNNVWIRLGVTACLTTENASTWQWLLGHLPFYFTQNPNGELSPQGPYNPVLESYLQVLGWGLDYVQGQYDMQLRHLNDPMAISIPDLVALAGELGLPYDPMISVYLMRKAAANWAHVAEERGTALGLTNQLELLTGFDVDLQIGQNLTLDNDQSYFPDPGYAAWDQYTSYLVGEIISYGEYLYQCLIAGSVGISPTGLATSNSNWQIVQDEADPAGVLDNSDTGGIGTWEVIYPGRTNGTGPAGSLVEAIGQMNPANSANWQTNSLKLINQSTTQDMYVRSVSRTTTDKEATETSPFAPDQLQVIGDGIPVPFTLPSQVWMPDIRYGTGDIVTYQSQPFLALRASTGITPTPGRTATPEWTPLSTNERLRLMVSAATMQDPLVESSQVVPVTPFVEWYDMWGNFIARVTARTPTAGTPGLPDNLLFDAFVLSPATTIGGRTFENNTASSWTAAVNNFNISLYAGGVTYPATQARSIAWTTGPANGQAAVTFITEPSGSLAQGLLFRGASSSSYWKATMTGLYTNNGGTITLVDTYSTPAFPGDRVTAQFNGTSITILVNDAAVMNTTSSFNETATLFGIIVE